MQSLLVKRQYYLKSIFECEWPMKVCELLELLARCDPQGQVSFIGYSDEGFYLWSKPTEAFCVWEADQLLFEDIVPVEELVLVRKERRRIPRGGA